MLRLKTKNSSAARGISRLGILLTVLILIVGFFIGQQVIVFYYSYYELVGHMEAQGAKASMFNDRQIRKFIMKRIKRLDIPITNPDKINIVRYNDRIVIETKYQEVLFLDLGDDRVYDLWVFDFHPRAEEPF